MTTQFPVFIKGTKIIPQPNCCFVYSLENKTFDIFNYESLIFFSEMDGATSNQAIVTKVASNFPEVSSHTISSDLKKLESCLERRGYLRLTDSPETGLDVFEFLDRIDEVKIVQADVEITKNCNLRCKYCFNESAHGSPELPLESWVELLDSLFERGLRVIKVSGGEPFLYPSILEFLDYAQQRFLVSVNTSGYFIDDRVAQRLSEMHLQAVQVSLDSSSAPIHDALRGKGTWDKASNAIKVLHDRGIPVRISTTVTAVNFEDLPNIKKFADSYGAELSLEVLKKVGKATQLDQAYFVSNPEGVLQYSDKAATHRILDELFLTCQAQLGVVGISYRGNIKPCNLTEDFFADRNAGVVVRFKKGGSYADSATLTKTQAASEKVVALLKSGEIKSKDRCIFEY